MHSDSAVPARIKMQMNGLLLNVDFRCSHQDYTGMEFARMTERKIVLLAVSLNVCGTGTPVWKYCVWRNFRNSMLKAIRVRNTQ